MAKLIALFYYSIFVSAISGGTTNEGFLLLGGVNASYYYTDKVEAYGSNLSLPSLPSLPFPLNLPIAEMTESGAVYVTGGSIGFSSNDKTFFLSSLSSSKWEEVEARMPKPVQGAGSVVVGDIVLVFGGWNHSIDSDVIQMLNTNKSLPTWKLLNQTLPEPLYTHSAAVYKDQVIILTRSGVTYTTSVSSIISDTELDWVEGELPGVEGCGYGPGVEVVEGKLVAVCKRKVFIKTTMDSQWIHLKPLPQRKTNYPSIGSVQGNIVIAGGYDHDDDVGTTDTVFMWVEASNEWKEVTSLKKAREMHATVQLPRGDVGTTIIAQEPKPATSTNRTPSPNN